MAETREVQVRLVADVAEFNVAVKRAAKLTRKLGKALQAVNDARICVSATCVRVSAER